MSGYRLRGLCRLAAALLPLLPAVGIGAAPGVNHVRIFDGSGGATCDYFDAALRLPWLKRGGDWTDAKGETGGASPYATARVTTISNPVELDVTQLLAEAMKDGNFAGFFVSGIGGGEVVVASREYGDPALHPELVLTLSSGGSVRLVPRADTYSNCTTNGSLGTRTELRAGAGQSIIFDFDLDPDVVRRATKATLRLSPTKLYGRSALLSVYRLGGRASERTEAPRAGIASGTPESRLTENSEVLFYEGFEDTRWERHWSILGELSAAERVSAGPAPLQGNALKVTIKKGAKLGLDLRYRFREKLGFEPEEAYLRYYVYFPNSWETPVDGGKLPGLSGTYGKAGWGGRTPNGYNGWNMRMIFLRQPPPGHPMFNTVTIGTEASIPEVPGVQKEGHFTWAKGHAGALAKNRWYSIEQYVKLNTPGLSDGIIRGWVDGRLAFERTNVLYRQTPDLKIEEAWMNVYHGGGQPTPRDITMYIDNVVIAKRYIGPMKSESERAAPRVER